MHHCEEILMEEVRSQKAAVACHRPSDVLVMWLLMDGLEGVVSGEGWRLWVAEYQDPCAALISPRVLRTHSLSHIPANPLTTSDGHQFLPRFPVNVDLYCIRRVSQQPQGHSWASVLGPVANVCAVPAAQCVNLQNATGEPQMD